MLIALMQPSSSCTFPFQCRSIERHTIHRKVPGGSLDVLDGLPNRATPLLHRHRKGAPGIKYRSCTILHPLIPHICDITFAHTISSAQGLLKASLKQALRNFSVPKQRISTWKEGRWISRRGFWKCVRHDSSPVCLVARSLGHRSMLQDAIIKPSEQRSAVPQLQSGLYMPLHSRLERHQDLEFEHSQALLRS